MDFDALVGCIPNPSFNLAVDYPPHSGHVAISNTVIDQILFISF